MVDLKHYLEDGACWQAKMVLAYLQGHFESVVDKSWNDERGCYDAEIKVGRFENCREQGYTVCCTFAGATACWAFYEHRNSDEIHVLRSAEDLGCYVDETPSIDFMWSDGNGGSRGKYDTDKHFEYNEAFQCGEWLAGEMKNFIAQRLELRDKQAVA